MEGTHPWCMEIPVCIHVGEVNHADSHPTIIQVMDSHLKNRNRLVSAIVSFHLHLVCVFFAFSIGEDCDVINAFLAASFAFVYNTSKGWLSKKLAMFQHLHLHFLYLRKKSFSLINSEFLLVIHDADDNNNFGVEMLSCRYIRTLKLRLYSNVDAFS